MDITKHTEFFDRHASLLATYLSSGANADTILEKLNLAQQGPISITYAPFDHVPVHADLVIVGITPGRTQAISAITAASTALRAGKDNKEASRLAKITGSFSGPMRTNLISLLDHIGLASALRIATCASLFDPDRQSVHLTSALRYPVFRRRRELQRQPGYA